MADDDEKTIGALRLAVFSSLPVGHQRYLSQKVTDLCKDWLHRHRVVSSEVTPSELASEIWLKLVSTLSPTHSALGRSGVGATDPRDDNRVLWLIAEIGGSQAIQHRYDDIRRQRYGRGGRLRQPGEETNEIPDERPDYQYGGMRHLQDVRATWMGMLIAARREFAEADDVILLLQLLAEEAELLEENWGNQWPIQLIVDLLKVRPPPRDWVREQVDTAKRRLNRWIVRLMREKGLDDTDLEAFFATVARESTANEKRQPPPQPDDLN